MERSFPRRLLGKHTASARARGARRGRVKAPKRALAWRTTPQSLSASVWGGSSSSSARRLWERTKREKCLLMARTAPWTKELRLWALEDCGGREAPPYWRELP